MTEEEVLRKELNERIDYYYNKMSKKVSCKAMIVFAIATTITMILCLFLDSVTGVWFECLRITLFIGAFVMFCAMITIPICSPMMPPEEFGRVLSLKCRLAEINEDDRADLEQKAKEIKENPFWPYFKSHFNQS